MSAENVVINFVGKTDKLKPVENALGNIIAQSGEVGQAWGKAASAMNNQTKTSTESTNKLAKSIDALATAAKSMDKAVIGGAYKEYLKQIQAQLGLTSKELITYIQNARKAAQEGIFSAGSDEEIDQMTMAIEAMNDQLKELGAWEGDVGEKTQSLRSRIKEAKDELVAMAEAGLQGTPAFRDLQEKAGELDDQMRDLNATVKGLGSDTKRLDGLISAVSGLAGGFAVAQGTAALFGDESEEVQKALLKVNAAMSILQGLQAIQNVLQKESAAMLLLQEGRTKAVAIANQFMAATTLETAAATTVLRTALITSGIGAIVVILGLAANAMGAFGDDIEDTTESMKKQNDVADSLYESYLKISKVNQLQINRDISIKQNEAEIALLKSQEGSIVRINDLQKENLRLSNESLQVELFGLKAAQAMASDKTQFTRRELELKSQIFENTQEQLRLDVELNKVLAERALKSATNQADAEIAKAKLAVAENEVDKVASIRRISDAEIRAIRVKEAAEIASGFHTAGEINKIHAEADLAVREKQIELQSEILNIQKAGISARLKVADKGSEDEYDYRLQLLEKEMEIALNRAKLTKDEKLEIENDFYAKKRELDNQFEQQHLQNEISMLSASLDMFGITEGEKLDLTIQRLNKQRDLEILQAENNAAKIAEINAKYDKQTIEAKKAAIKAILDDNLKTFEVFSEKSVQANKKIVESQFSSGADKVKALNDIQKFEDAKFDLQHKALTKQVEDGLLTAHEFDVAYKELLNKRQESEENTQKQISEIYFKETEKRIAFYQAVFAVMQKGLDAVLDTGALKTALGEFQNVFASITESISRLKVILDDPNISPAEKTKARLNAFKEEAAAVIQATQAVVNQMFADSTAARQQALNDQLSLLEAQKQKELDNKGLTEQQKADIEEKYREKERQEKIKAFKADKEAKKTQAAINGLLGITNAYATAPTIIAGIVLAALVAVSTAIQVAKISSTPVPRFKHGKQKGGYEGFGIVDDGGKFEPIWRKDGSIEVATGRPKERLTYLHKDDMVFPSMEAMYKHFSFPQVPEFVQPKNQSQSIDYDKLAEAVATKMAGIIPAPAQIYNAIDGDSLKQFMLTGNTKTEIKNKYFSMS